MAEQEIPYQAIRAVTMWGADKEPEAADLVWKWIAHAEAGFCSICGKLPDEGHGHLNSDELKNGALRAGPDPKPVVRCPKCKGFNLKDEIHREWISETERLNTDKRCISCQLLFKS